MTFGFKAKGSTVLSSLSILFIIFILRSVSFLINSSLCILELLILDLLRLSIKKLFRFQCLCLKFLFGFLNCYEYCFSLYSFSFEFLWFPINLFCQGRIDYHYLFLLMVFFPYFLASFKLYIILNVRFWLTTSFDS
jgi:hypothetical protein